MPKPIDQGINRLCLRCREECKQPGNVSVVNCPWYFEREDVDSAPKKDDT